MAVLNREDWMQQIGDQILDDILMPEARALGLDRPEVGYMTSFPPAVRKPEKVMGFCMAKKCSSDSVNRVSLNPSIDDSLKAAAVITHELIHAILDNSDGHKGRFAKIAKAVGFESPLDQFNPTERLHAQLQPYIEFLGAIPTDAVILPNVQIKKKQTNRQLKCECTMCGFTFRASKTQLASLTTESPCPVCEERGTLEIEEK